MEKTVDSHTSGGAGATRTERPAASIFAAMRRRSRASRSLWIEGRGRREYEAEQGEASGAPRMCRGRKSTTMTASRCAPPSEKVSETKRGEAGTMMHGSI